ncbi:hypothetical protein TWF730_007660 [Orbilia blumenaviensis]|uniref:Uncharacterized protein n=1 Tax=Orbilia blumenaviensis TaxID=1796055 RepID=A0AAV9V8Z2_9PEZI
MVAITWNPANTLNSQPTKKANCEQSVRTWLSTYDTASSITTAVISSAIHTSKTRGPIPADPYNHLTVRCYKQNNHSWTFHIYVEAADGTLSKDQNPHKLANYPNMNF